MPSLCTLVRKMFRTSVSVQSEAYILRHKAISSIQDLSLKNYWKTNSSIGYRLRCEIRKKKYIPSVLQTNVHTRHRWISCIANGKKEERNAIEIAHVTGCYILRAKTNLHATRKFRRTSVRFAWLDNNLAWTGTEKYLISLCIILWTCCIIIKVRTMYDHLIRA